MRIEQWQAWTVGRVARLSLTGGNPVIGIVESVSEHTAGLRSGEIIERVKLQVITSGRTMPMWPDKHNGPEYWHVEVFERPEPICSCPPPSLPNVTHDVSLVHPGWSGMAAANIQTFAILDEIQTHFHLDSSLPIQNMFSYSWSSS